LGGKSRHPKIIKPNLQTCTYNSQNVKPNPTPKTKTSYKHLDAYAKQIKNTRQTKNGKVKHNK